MIRITFVPTEQNSPMRGPEWVQFLRASLLKYLRQTGYGLWARLPSLDKPEILSDDPLLFI